MEQIKSLVALALIAGLAACNSTPKEEIATEETIEVVEMAAVTPNASTTLDVEGMTCEMGCKAAIEKHLSKTAGVAKCEIDFDKAVAVVDYDNTIITEEQIIAEIGEVANHAYSAKPHVETPINEQP